MEIETFNKYNKYYKYDFISDMYYIILFDLVLKNNYSFDENIKYDPSQDMIDEEGFYEIVNLSFEFYKLKPFKPHEFKNNDKLKDIRFLVVYCLYKYCEYLTVCHLWKYTPTEEICVICDFMCENKNIVFLIIDSITKVIKELNIKDIIKNDLFDPMHALFYSNNVIYLTRFINSYEIKNCSNVYYMIGDFIRKYNKNKPD